MLCISEYTYKRELGEFAMSTLRDELEKIVEEKLKHSQLSPKEKKAALDKLNQDLEELKTKNPAQYQLLTKKENKEFLVIAYCAAIKDPKYNAFIKDNNLINLMLTPQNKLRLTPKLQLTMTKLKLFIKEGLEALKNDKEHKLSPEQQKKLDKITDELENHMREADELNKQLQMDFETMAIIHYRGKDTRTGMNQTYTDTIIDGLYEGIEGQIQGEIKGPTPTKVQVVDPENDPTAPAETEEEEKTEDNRLPDYQNPFKTKLRPPGSPDNS